MSCTRTTELRSVKVGILTSNSILQFTQVQTPKFLSSYFTSLFLDHICPRPTTFNITFLKWTLIEP